ncbi:MAG: radical SAM family heme chaperone HemW [Treponemataceae bacterium]|nr:radical SAM family heme chaperone HemW [Treponemataceae bacterium]
MEASVYIHIPFCAQKCDYCDFYSVPLIPSLGQTSVLQEKLWSFPFNENCKVQKETSPRQRRITRIVPVSVLPTEKELSAFYDLFCTTLLKELYQNIKEFSIERVPTLYIGGGTPSILGARQLEKLLISLHQLVSGWPEESTLEANPESLDESILKVCKERGITRISLGIQTLNDQSRQAVHRAGSASHCLASLERALYCYGGELSVDLISGLPFQTVDTLISDLETLCQYPISHISLYALTVEEGTLLARRAAMGENILPEREFQEELWLTGRDWLVSHGFEQYEVSNFARAGAICKHNMRYWKMQSWIGCGPAASTTVIDEKRGTALRRTVEEEVNTYCTTGPRYREEQIDQETFKKECLMMGFRTTQGPDPVLFEQRFGISIETSIPQTLERWRRQGLCEKHRPALTPEGLRYANTFIVECFQELEEKNRRAESRDVLGDNRV